MIFHDCDGDIVRYDGSPLSWRVSAYVIVSQRGRILLIKNREEKLFDVPGGGIEMDESISDAIHRECLEEAGIRVKLHGLLSVTEDYFFHREEKKFFKTIQLFYRAGLIGEIGQATDPRTEMVRFVSLHELDTYPLPLAVLQAIGKV